MEVKLISVTKPIEDLTPEGLIAYCARVSSPHQENPNYAKLLKYCIDKGHWSIFEMADMTVEIVTSRAIAAQILRHKSFSFQEHCISGDTLITTIAKCGKTKKIPISTLYEYQSDPRMQAIWQKGVRVYDEETRTLKRALIKEVFKTGIKPVWEVILSNGKKIKTTMEHKFYTQDGFVPLESLSVGSFVGMNGIPVYQSKEWLLSAKKKSIEDKSGLDGIANAAGCSYHTIRKWLRIHGLQFTRHEVASYTDTWNKGLPPEQQPRYGKLCGEETRQKQRDSSTKGQDSRFYINGNSSNRSFRQQVYDWQNKYKNHLLKKFNGMCCQCGSIESLQIDHIKNVALYPESAFDLANLQILCAPCHSAKSIKETVEARLTCSWHPIKSITYVGEEETYDMEVDHVSHNYVGNGFIVHNSQRYAEAFGYEEYQARRQDTKNRQNSIDDLPDIVKAGFLEAQQSLWNFAYSEYEVALSLGIAKECARMLLPLNTRTRLYMKGSVRSWIHYFAVRCDESTQLEHREIANAIKAIFCEQFPTIAEVI